MICFESVLHKTKANSKYHYFSFVGSLVDYYNFVYDDLDVDGISNGFVEEVKEKEAKDPGDHGSLLVLTIREILWNYSDGSHTFSEKISQTDLFQKLVRDLEIIKEDDLTDMEVFVIYLFKLTLTVSFWLK